MDVGRADVLRMAALARIALSDPEAEALRRDLQEILDHVDALPDLSGAGSAVLVPDPAAPDSSAPGSTAPGSTAPGGRPDEPGADPLAGGIEAFAPELRDGLFAVPRLASHTDPEPE